MTLLLILSIELLKPRARHASSILPIRLRLILFMLNNVRVIKPSEVPGAIEGCDVPMDQLRGMCGERVPLILIRMPSESQTLRGPLVLLLRQVLQLPHLLHQL